MTASNPLAFQETDVIKALKASDVPETDRPAKAKLVIENFTDWLEVSETRVSKVAKLLEISTEQATELVAEATERVKIVAKRAALQGSPAAATQNQPVGPQKFIIEHEKTPDQMSVIALIKTISDGHTDDEYLDAIEAKTAGIPFVVLSSDKKSWDKDETLRAWDHNKDNARPDRHWGKDRIVLLTVTGARQKTSPAHPLDPYKKLAAGDPWLTERTEDQLALVAFRAYRNQLTIRDEDSAFEDVAKNPLPRSWREAQSDWNEVKQNDKATMAVVLDRLVYKKDRARPFRA